jgi:hypothetical protein
MDAAELPVDVLVTALTSRLADLQSARSDIDSQHIVAPQTFDGADRRALIASHLLSALEQRLIEGSSGFVAISIVTETICARLLNATQEEIRYCARFLDVDREIRFRRDGDDETRTTRSWTRLVRYQTRLDRVKLTEAGRLFLKVLRHRRDWLYEDKHVEMLTRALHSGLFDDIPRLCQEILASLRLFNEQLTAIRESPSIRTMAEQYEQRRTHFTTMLDRALQAALTAMELLNTQDVQEALARFLEQNPTAGLSHASLRRALNLVHQATESLHRNWARFLHDLQRSKRQPLGVVRFDEVRAEFLKRPPSTETLTALLAGCGGWLPQSQLLSVSSFIGTLPMRDVPAVVEPVVFDDDPALTSDLDVFSSWLRRHASEIIAALKKGPVKLSTLLAAGAIADLPLESGSDLGGLVGAYVVPEPFKEAVDVEVVCEPDIFTATVCGYRVIASNLILMAASKESKGTEVVV